MEEKSRPNNIQESKMSLHSIDVQEIGEELAKDKNNNF